MDDIINDNGKARHTAIIGGTFHALHQGHRYYIKLAFDFAEEIIILLTSDKYAQMCKSYRVLPYELRKKAIQDYVNEIAKGKKYQIITLQSDSFLINFCTENDFTMAILVPEYYSLFQKINFIREDEGKKPLLLLVTPRIKTKEGFDISSTLINNLISDQQLHPTEYSPELVSYVEALRTNVTLPNCVPQPQVG